MLGKLIFLDIDGVLNNYKCLLAGRSIDHKCVAHLNWLLGESSAKLVISSTWRRLIDNGHMDCRGFAYMLRTHGLAGADVVGWTRQSRSEETRGHEIRDWRREHKHAGKYVCLDDDDDISYLGLTLVQTNGAIGLTRGDAERALELLS